MKTFWLGMQKASSAWVHQQTAVYGTSGVSITTGDHTQINGALVAALNDNLTLTTRTLGFADTGVSVLMSSERGVAVPKDVPDAIVKRLESGIGETLKVISKHGVGTDSIDKAAASARGIPVLVALGSNSQAVAEHTIALMLAYARHLPALDARMTAGHWDKDGYQGLELAGTTLGLIGLGAIGSRVARIADAFGQTVLVHDPFIRLDGLPVRPVALDVLLRTSNVISLHCPLTAATRHLLDRSRISLLKRGSIVLNTARAELVDEVALIDALAADQLVAGIDCFTDEPLAPGSSWLTAPNTVLTPHIGGTTAAALRAMGVGAAQHILISLRPTNAQSLN